MTDFSPAVFGPPALRVGTAEREQAAEALGKHFAAGRLEVDEYDERVARAYAAKTADDLSVLFTDLPGPATMRPVAAAPPSRSARAFLPLALIAVVVLAAVVAVTTHIVPFFIFPLFFFLFLRSRGGFGHRHRGSRRF
ncbi:DUF1707 domain-containing protein [Nocardia sp. SYP-A9097]|uniref:DUF1707 SHOCT-like domain-containing protein n=1 Tax=Nocardia sp. SYP-A9097 TaxID=2663237 RepID=UPI00129AEE1D|nr:DUF1707 domain-containing protein [Nocardia sp. SYP-A9097]MRH90610.1 DUF1707 domain-containing protein [Nocardia sp. SYP-A9097]